MRTVRTERDVTVHVDPAMAEAAVWRVITTSASSRRSMRAEHDRRTASVYELPDAGQREAGFAALARAEFGALGLAGPLLTAIFERPVLASRARVVLVGGARAANDEGVTCEPGGEHLGFRLEATRFGDPDGLLRWARHALGHAEDAIDPTFGFVPGWDGDGRGQGIRTAAQARLHRLWDISVDGRLAAAGSFGEYSRTRHGERLWTDLPGASPEAVDAVLDRLWSGPRPDFPALLHWADRPADLLADVIPAEMGMIWPDRCPLCRFPSDDVRRPSPMIAGRVRVDYPWWRPELGLCGRCTDRYRLSERLGGRP